MNTERLIGLDIETVKPFPQGEDWRDHRPLGISVLAISSMVAHTQFYAAGDDGYPGYAMELYQAADLVDQLQYFIHEGATLVTWNGMGFDWPVIAEESGRLEDVRELARNHNRHDVPRFLRQRVPVEPESRRRGYEGRNEVGGRGRGAGARSVGLWGQGRP